MMMRLGFIGKSYQHELLFFMNNVLLQVLKLESIFTLLLGTNVLGNLKFKLMCHSHTPRALKGLNKDMLPVYWKFNKKAWVTQDVSQTGKLFLL